MSGGPAGCSVCSDNVARRLVDEEFDKGQTGTYVSRLMTGRGFRLSADVVNRHRRENHRVDYETDTVATARAAKQAERDAAKVVKEKTLLYMMAEEFDIASREGERVAKLALQAQGLEDKRERNKPKQQFFLQLFMEQQGESKLLADPEVIEGEARDVTDE